MPWLQETPTNRVWTLWDVTYRDLRILDSSNRLASVLNLTSHNLAEPENFATAKAMFLAAANGGDGEHDGLPDHWEAQYFPRTLADKNADSDGDGYINLVEFAFGANPRDPLSHPVLHTDASSPGTVSFSFTRWAGSTLNFIVEVSTNLASWNSSPRFLDITTTNLYDGTGRAKTICTLVHSNAPQPAAYLRLKTQPRP